MNMRLDAEQLLMVEAGKIATYGALASAEEIARLKSAMEPARALMNDDIRTRIFDACAEIVREGPSEGRAQALFQLLAERQALLCEQRAAARLPYKD